ncbi:hypothetical protein CK203_061692 [Vitis vinifera]|uniref:Reverse transcriptase RNase H-like domain-containing protein n=1 Tax=Vitis vinifera TaxID=29760 RepID=A0A438G849_VITVI|nr:hypothetical protein CK203_061692 [Vitis vinifera]
MLVDSTAGHSMLSFMDGFSGATYQRAATTLFHDMMHRDVEFRLRLNPKKCTFGVTSGKLLGHIVSERGIEVDPEKSEPYLTCLLRGLRERLEAFLFGMMIASTFEKIKECLLFSSFSASHTEATLLLYLSVSDMALGCMLAHSMIQEGASHLLSELMRWLVLLTEFDIQYVTHKSVKGSIVADHLASFPVSDDRPIDDDFLMSSLSHPVAFYDHHRLTNNIVEYEAHHRFEELRYIHLPRAENQFADALATLASVIEIPGSDCATIVIETRSTPAYYCLIGDIEDQDELPWRALRQLATRFVICGSPCTDDRPRLIVVMLDRASADRVMREVHAGVCGPHMGGHMLEKIMRIECQMHGDLIHMPPSELHALTSPWPFSVWGIDVIGKSRPSLPGA